MRLAATVLTGAVLLLFGRGILAWWARHMAARQMNVGATSAAQQWLAWSAWLDPGDGTTELMRAACFRHLEQDDPWIRAVEAARQKGAPPMRVRQEVNLGLIQSGRFYPGAENDLGALIEAGVSPHEVAAVYVHGYLARGKPETAKMALDAWAADHPEEARVAYMRGVYWRSLGWRTRAQEEFENALARQPRHQLARTALAELFEEQGRLDQALEQFLELATRAPASETAQASLARVLRKRGRIDEARAVLEPLAAPPEPPSEVAAEMGQIELVSGNYAEAEAWFERADLDRANDYQKLAAAATAFALQGKTLHAERLFARLDTLSSRRRRLGDLRDRLSIDPHDEEAHREVQRLSALSTSPPEKLPASETRTAREDRQEGRAASAAELYALHCSACHGANGDGNGRAARHLFPRPRDLRTGKSRLVSTLNGVATLEDLEVVIERGMPGTSMRSFEDLSKEQRRLLAEEVRRLNREGIREQFTGVLRSEGEAIDEAEVAQVVALSTTPEEVVRVPQIGPADGEAIARGKAAYFRLGCDHCHGADGTGVWDEPLLDEKGRPSPARDLVEEPFKGGHEPESIYLRIYVGMPGSPHPASYNVAQPQLIDLVHYCGSLSREPKRVLTNYERAVQATRRRTRLALAGGKAISKTPISKGEDR